MAWGAKSHKRNGMKKSKKSEMPMSGKMMMKPMMTKKKMSNVMNKFKAY